MAICVDFSPALSDHSSRRQSFNFSPLASPIHSAYHTPREDGSPRLFALSASPSPRNSINFGSSTSSLPALAAQVNLSPRPASVALPKSPTTPKAAQPAQDPDTPRRVDPVESPSSPSKALASPSKELKRSLSLPAVADPDSLSQVYPSPSSTFSPPPDDEAAIISGLLARDRARRQSEAAPRPDVAEEARTHSRKRSASIGSAEARRVTSLQTNVALPATDESLSPLSATSTPVSKSISGSTASRFSHPSRPTSDYMPRLDGSAGTSVVPATPGLARRLSMSISRRDSEQQVPLAVKPSPAVVIRDFAFSSSDPRYAGEGQPPPAPAPVRNSSGLWGPSTSSLARTPSGLGGSSWDDLASGEGAGGGLLSSGSSSTFSWGFVTSHAEAAAVDEISESMDEDDEDDQPVDLGPIPEGGALFVATYDFEPEASQEMRLAAGEVVRVYERICEGWVVAGRLRADDAPAAEEETGLVPENYLAPHKTGDVDSDDDDA